MRTIFLLFFICFFLEGVAQRSERFTFHLENGICRRVEGIQRSKTISLIDVISGKKQRNRYDSWVNSIGFTYDLRKNPNKGFSVGLELKHQFSNSELKFRTQPLSSFDSFTLYSFDQRISLFAIGPSIKGTGKLLDKERFRLNYLVGGELQIHFASKDHIMEFREYGTNSYSHEFNGLSYLHDSAERIEIVNTHWFSLLWGLELTIKSEGRLKWGIRLYNDLWFDSPTTISIGNKKWNYSDETGIGLIVKY